VKVIPSSVSLVRDPQQLYGHVPGHNEGWVTGTGSSAERVGACPLADLYRVTTVIAGRGTCRPT